MLEKKDGVTQYTSNQLLKSLENGEDQAYFYSLTTLNAQSESEWLLLKLPREAITITINSDPFVPTLIIRSHTTSFWVWE